MRSIMIGATSVAAAGFVIGACTTHETRIVEAPAVVGVPPGTTMIKSNRMDAPVVIESVVQRDIIVKVD